MAAKCILPMLSLFRLCQQGNEGKGQKMGVLPVGESKATLALVGRNLSGDLHDVLVECSTHVF